MNRFKARIAAFLVVSAATTVFFGGSPALASDSCHPFPEAYCNTITYLNNCVFWQPPAEYCDS